MKRPSETGFDLRPLLMMPSFYGGTGWIIAFSLYWLRVLDWNPDSTASTIIFVAVAICFPCSTFFFLPRYRRMAFLTSNEAQNPGRARGRGMPPWLLLLHAAGLLGIVIYVRDMAQVFGGLGGFFSVLLSASHLIRMELAHFYSVGTQLSYFGWMAAALTAHRCFHGKLGKGWLGLVLLQILVNALWIDRTRPTTIVFLCYAMYLLSRRRWTLSRAMLSNGALAAGGMVLFVVIGSWIGKIHESSASDLQVDMPPAVANTCFYLTSSFAFCNDVLSNDEPLDEVPYTIAPLAKVLEALGLLDEAPNLLHEFRSVPFATNVGTFLTIFYWDGGWPYLAFAILFYTFILDLLGLWFLSFRSPVAALGWATLCWIGCMAFFGPKIAATELWLFLGVAVIGALTAIHRPRLSFATAGRRRMIAATARQPNNHFGEAHL